jgi:2-dehydropantoate 2-reductase
MAAYALESAGEAEVTMVLRSNFNAVKQNGFTIDSIEHGRDISGWRPSHLIQKVPSAEDVAATPFDYIIVATKNIPDVKPTVVDIIEEAVTPGKTSILLLQNGLNIERPIIARFPENVVLSGVSLISTTETQHGVIRHDYTDDCKVGPFFGSGSKVQPEVAKASARRLVDAYNACGKVNWAYDEDVPFTRWRKLVYNSSFNSVAAVTGMDTARMRMSDFVIDDLVLPIMLEIKAVAKAAGIDLPEGIEQKVIRIDPTDTAFVPSMGQDAAKVLFLAFQQSKAGTDCKLLSGQLHGDRSNCWRAGTGGKAPGSSDAKARDDIRPAQGKTAPGQRAERLVGSEVRSRRKVCVRYSESKMDRGFTRPLEMVCELNALIVLFLPRLVLITASLRRCVDGRWLYGLLEKR